MEDYNEYENHTLEELYDLLDAEEERLLSQYEEPINYYSPGDSMTYLSAMSQHWGIEANKDRIEQIETEISRRCKAHKSTNTLGATHE
tara:strand:- start:1538 stop:1801 length:264 start_codon:yes stop_codon:yes gene_type:complete